VRKNADFSGTFSLENKTQPEHNPEILERENQQNWK
jgi:hypothetical protein